MDYLILTIHLLIFITDPIILTLDSLIFITDSLAFTIDSISHCRLNDIHYSLILIIDSLVFKLMSCNWNRELTVRMESMDGSKHTSILLWIKSVPVFRASFIPCLQTVYCTLLNEEPPQFQLSWRRSEVLEKACTVYRGSWILAFSFAWPVLIPDTRMISPCFPTLSISEMYTGGV